MSDPNAFAGQAQLVNDPPPEARRALGYSDLAWWAEKADGAEGENLVIAWVEADKTAVLETQADADKQGHKTLLKGIKLPKTPRKTKRAEEILVKVEGKSDPIPATIDGVVCDAVFTTPSAIRKFVLLYYQAHRLLDKARWEKLQKVINDPKVPAVGHIHPSTLDAVGTGSDLWLLQPKLVGKEMVGEWVSLDDYKPSEEAE
jgi:hypothetical protein